MLIKNLAMSMPIIGVVVDTAANSEFKKFMKGTLSFAGFFESVGFKKLITDVVNTAHSTNFSKRVLKYDAFTLTIDQPYSQNTMFGIAHQATTTPTDLTVTTRKGKKSLVTNVPTLTSGAIIECPATMVLACLCAREQLVQTKERNALSAAQQSEWASSKQNVENELTRLSQEQAEIILFGEQAIAVSNGDVYFHQPVSVNWLHFVTQVDFDLAPAAIRAAVTDYRARSVDIYKGITGTAGTLTEIEAILDSYGVGAHMTSTPWLKLPNRPSFEFELTEDVRSFLVKNGKYALALFTNYMQSAYTGMLFDAKNVSGVMYDLAMKLTRLGFPNEFETDSQDASVSYVVARAFADKLATMGSKKHEILDHFEALMDVRLRRLNFNVTLPQTMTRSDLIFYKKALTALRRTRAKWPTELSSNCLMKTDANDVRLELTMPSGVVATVRMAESVQYDFNRNIAIQALSAPADPMVDDLMDFMEVVESLFLFLMSKDVKRGDILTENTATMINVGGVYRMLSDSLHFAISSPNPTILIPVAV